MEQKSRTQRRERRLRYTSTFGGFSLPVVRGLFSGILIAALSIPGD
jgi:hypothetical protein